MDNKYFYNIICWWCSVVKSRPTLCNPMDSSMPGFPVLDYLLEFAQTHVNRVKSVILSNLLILCHPLLLLPLIFASIRVFSNESALIIMGPKYWSFSFSISPFSEYSGMISFRIDWFDLLAVQGTLKNLLQHHNLKAPILQHSLLDGPTLSSVYDYWKNHSFDDMKLGQSNDVSGVKLLGFKSWLYF